MTLPRDPAVGANLLVVDEMSPPHRLPRFFDSLNIQEPMTRSGDLGLAPPLAERIVALDGGAGSVENPVPPGIRWVARLKRPAAPTG
jgi:hypothetical protein